MAISERLKKINIEDYDIYEENAEITPELSELCEDLSKELSQKIAGIPIWFDYTKDEQQELISSFLTTQLNEQFNEIKLTSKEIERISNKFYESIYGFGSLDFLIAQKDINQVFVNSPVDIYIDRKGNIEKTNVVLDDKQYASLINWLLNFSKKDSPIITTRINSLFITLIREPVCKTKLIIKKISDKLFNLQYFEKENILNSGISDFLKYLLDSKYHVLISAPAQCGKTLFINALINELDEDTRVTLFENGGLINTNKININRYDTEDLSDNELKQLITAALYFKPNYIISDINNINFNINITDSIRENIGFIAAIRANAPLEALNLYSSAIVSRLKCTEKLAKKQFASNFDYIIQLEYNNNKLFNLQAIYELGCNKNGTVTLTEVLNNHAGKLSYNFNFEKTKEDIQQINTSENQPKNISFSTRFNL